jgi:antagonist of KipI
MIRIVAAGMRATVQDRGRLGHLREGVPPSGPADPFAFEAAQALVGNDESAAAIEIVGSPFTFTCDDRRIVAVTGRDVTLRTRDRIPGWTAAFVRAGDEVSVIAHMRSRFAYLAVSGGIAIKPVLGSRATYLPARLGGIVRAGDALPLGDARVDPERAGSSIEPPEYQDEQMRAITGPHVERFTRDAVRAFFSAEFTVDGASDRMATRLAGPRVAVRVGEILTCGVIAGAVQIPSGGAPIVLLADHQVTGGYPVIATVIASDIGRVAQRLPGEPLRFDEVDRDRAVELARERRRALAEMA